MYIIKIKINIIIIIIIIIMIKKNIYMNTSVITCVKEGKEKIFMFISCYRCLYEFIKLIIKH